MIGRWICFGLAALLSLSTFAIGLVELLFRWQVKPRLESNVALQERYLPSYRDDQTFLHENARAEILRNKPPATQAQADAGPYLNPRLYWAPPSSGPSKTAPKPLVPVDVRETLLRFRGDWMKKFGRAEHMKADLSVFKGLGQFTFWDIEQSSPIGDLVLSHVFVPPPQLPIPEVSDLLALVKMRLMNGALTGDFVPALSDVRQLSQLLLTTENTQLVLAGLAALDDERFAYQFYVEERHLDPHLWIPIDRSITRRGHRAILATRNYLHLWTPPAVLEEIFMKPVEAPIGLCAAANDAFPIEYSLRAHLVPHWPFEISLQKEYARLDKVFQRAQSVCRLRYLNDMNIQDAMQAKIPGPFILSRAPYSRKIFGLRTSVINFNGFGSYETLAP